MKYRIITLLLCFSAACFGQGVTRANLSKILEKSTTIGSLIVSDGNNQAGWNSGVLWNGSNLEIGGEEVWHTGNIDKIWQLSGNNAFYDGGNVGIGTSIPTEKLHITDGKIKLDNNNTDISTDDDLLYSREYGGKELFFGRKALKGSWVKEINIVDRALNQYYEIAQLFHPNSIQGSVTVDVILNGSGFGNSISCELDLSYRNDWMLKYTGLTSNHTAWVVMPYKKFVGRGFLSEGDLLIERKVTNNSVQFRIRLNKSLESFGGIKTALIRLTHNDNDRNITITNLTGEGIDATTPIYDIEIMSTLTGAGWFFKDMRFLEGLADRVGNYGTAGQVLTATGASQRVLWQDPVNNNTDNQNLSNVLTQGNNAGNQKITGGAAGTNPADFVILSQLPTVSTASLGATKVGNDIQLEINNLPIETTIADANELAITVSGVDKKITFADFKAGLSGVDAVTVNQTAHGFDIGDPIFYDKGTWAKAQTANFETLPTAFVKSITDVNNFDIEQGEIIEKTAHGYAIGEKQYLQTDGSISSEKGASIVCEVFTAVTANHLQVNRTKAFSLTNLFNNLETRNNTEWSVYEATTVSMRIKTVGGVGYSIFWGDGSQQAASSNTVYSKTYGSVFTGFIEIKGLDGTQIEEIELTGAFDFDINKVFTYAPNLEFFDMDGSALIYGDCSNMPNSMVYFDIQKGKIYGDITNSFRDGLERIRAVTDANIEFNWSELPESIEYIGITGGATGTKAYGSISSVQFTAPTHFDVQGESVLTGDLGLLGNFPEVLNLSGKCSIETYTAKANGGTMNYIDKDVKSFILAGNNVLSTAEIDNILIDLNSETTNWASPGNIIMTVGGATRSSSSDSAVTALQGKGATITINGVIQ